MNYSTRRVLKDGDETIDAAAGKVFETGKLALKPVELVAAENAIEPDAASNGLFLSDLEEYIQGPWIGYRGYCTPKVVKYLQLSTALALAARAARRLTSKTMRL